MKNFLLTGIVGLLTVGASVGTVLDKANALTSQLNANEISADLSTSSSDASTVQIDTGSTEIADAAWACNTYTDGSYACCIVDSYGNWYCESGW